MCKKEDIFDQIAPYKDEFRRHLLCALEEGLRELGNYVESGQFVSEYHDWKVVELPRGSGFPSFRKSFSGPKNYRYCFSQIGKNNCINEKNIKSFNDFLDFVKGRIYLADRFQGLLRKYPSSEFDEILVLGMVRDAIERYAHNYNSFDFEQEKAVEVVNPILKFFFERKLGFSIIVPILFVHFDFDEFSLGENTKIKEISKELHYARGNIGFYYPSVHETVLSSATHALVLENFWVENSEIYPQFNILSNPNAYSNVEYIDKFFGALRIAKGFDSGYAQLLFSPDGWEGRYGKSNLPYLEGVTVRNYPNRFESIGWNKGDFPRVLSSDAEEIKDIYQNLVNCIEKSVGVALKRLNSCFLRDTEEDSILDAAIGLEALFTNDGKSEMTHKLKMRVGAISKLSDEFKRKPEEVSSDIKDIYDKRSAIVHGSSKPIKKREIKIKGEKVPTLSMAIEYLRLSIKILLRYPEFQKPNNIDEKLLLGTTIDNSIIDETD